MTLESYKMIQNSTLQTSIKSQTHFLSSQQDACKLAIGLARDNLIVSLRKIDGDWHIISKYGDDIWWTTGKPTNLPSSRTKIDFNDCPSAFRQSMKEIVFRYVRKGNDSENRIPRAATAAAMFGKMIQFIKYIDSLGLKKISDVSPLVCLNYKTVAIKNRKKPGEKIKNITLFQKLQAVVAIFELSQYTNDPMPKHPWPNSSSGQLAGTAKGNGIQKGGRTPLIPDDIFVKIYQEAWNIVECAPLLLDWRDELQRFEETKTHLCHKYVVMLKNDELEKKGFNGNYSRFVALLAEMRTACYIVIASLSGCRTHELGYLRKNSVYSTTDDDGERYWWMRSTSEKTGEGATEWMIPEAAVTAIKVLERWAEPHQARLEKEISGYKETGADPKQLAEALEHKDALFLGYDSKKKGGRVRTLGTHPLNVKLKEFCTALGLKWNLATHQFRRKFANYAARSKFGDLRYLKEHFKHWSMDMTLGYALNESQEMELFLEIQGELEDIKQSVVSTWLERSEPLTGGYGRSLADWRTRSENITLFRNHDTMIRSISESTHIRSNGHAWCTAKDNLCVGNNLEKTRCGSGCENAVVGRQHLNIYQGLYDQLKELEASEDIGPSGRERIKRDVGRCKDILNSLGSNIKEVHHDGA
jgi:integrase